jgi:putative transposase
MTAENQTRRLHRLERIYVRSPIYFVTTCTADRRHVLATEAVHESFVGFAKAGPVHGAWIGAYVLIPDHLHAFVAYDDEKISLAGWMKSLKNALSKTLRGNGVPPPHW